MCISLWFYVLHRIWISVMYTHYTDLSCPPLYSQSMICVQVFAGDDGKSRIFRCTMKQNRRTCAAIYCEEEYERLVIEAYWQSRSKTMMANNRYKFECIHCKESHKDKNTVSYHRMFNLCKVYKGEEPLKMYPTWEPSEHGEKARIALKYGKVSSPTTHTAPQSQKIPPPLDLAVPSAKKRRLPVRTVEHAPPTKKRILAVKAATHCKPPLSTAHAAER